MRFARFSLGCGIGTVGVVLIVAMIVTDRQSGPMLSLPRSPTDRQPKRELPPSEDPQSPLQFEKPVIRLGTIPAGPDLTVPFRFRNRGKLHLDLKGARTTCGCVVPQLDRRMLAPGTGGNLEVRIRTLGERSGEHIWPVVVDYREGKTDKRVRLAIRATLETEVTVRPSSLQLHIRGAWKHRFRVLDGRPKAFRIIAVRTSSEHITATNAPFERNAAGHWCSEITMRVAESLPHGTHSETLAIYTDDPIYGELKVPLTIRKPEEPASRDDGLHRPLRKEGQQEKVRHQADVGIVPY